MATNNLPEPPEFIAIDGSIVERPKPKEKYKLPPGVLASDLFKREKVPSDYVLPGMIAATLGALIAPGSTGKSMLAMELATLVAGVDVLGIGEGWNLKSGYVVIFAVEDPANELFNRWTDLGSNLTPEQRKAGEKISVIPMLGHRFDIMDDEHFEALKEICTGKRMLILDTMRRIHSLDENDGGAMAAVIGRLEEIATLTGCAILFLHHTNKAATYNSSGDSQQASRGSSVLVDNIRFQMFMVGMNKDDDKDVLKQVDPELWKDFVRVGVSKVNYGKRIGDVWLRRADGGILLPAEFPSSYLTARKPEPESEDVLKGRKTAKNFNGGNW